MPSDQQAGFQASYNPSVSGKGVGGFLGGLLENIYGSKPDVPPLPEVKLPEEQQKAIAANIAAEPEAARLGRLSQENIRAMMRFAIPGFDQATGLVSNTLIDMLQGKIPSDVAAMTRIGTAGQALQGGYASGTPGSMGSNLEARNLGLTSLGIQQQGKSSLQSWIGAMEQLYSPSQALYSSMFITPAMEFQAAKGERDLQFQRSWLQNQINAMPDPVARGVYDTVMELVGDVLSVYGGGAKHQSYYGGGGAAGGVSGGIGGGAPGSNYGGDIWGWGRSQSLAGDNTPYGRDALGGAAALAIM